MIPTNLVWNAPLIVLAACALTAAAPPVARGAPVRVVIASASESSAPATQRRLGELQAAAEAAGAVWIDRSPAPAPAPTAPERRRRAIDAYEGLQFDAALAELNAAVAELDSRGEVGLEPAELSDLFLYRALTRTQLGDASAAWEDFIRTVILAPQRTLDPVRFPPRAIEAFERARGAVQALAPVPLRVEVPVGCEVIIDGLPRAQASVAPGDHFVAVHCDGQRVYGARVLTGQTAQVLSPDTARAPAATDAALLASAPTWDHEDRVVALLVHSSATSTALSLRRYEARTNRVLAARSLTLSTTDDDAAAAIRAALRELMAETLPTSAPTGPAAARPWHASPWLWGAVGAVATALVLTPFLLANDQPASTASIEPTGQLPW